MIWAIYGLVIVAVVVALAFASRRNKDVVSETRYDPPSKIERNDFPSLEGEILVVAFTSRVCDSCSNLIDKVKVLESGAVSTSIVEFEDASGKKLHSKYQIEAVPTTVICDENGVVVESHVGPVTATDLWAGVARARGGEIQGCGNHDS